MPSPPAGDFEARESPDGVGAVARDFARLGVTAFGGPAAHIALFRHEFVERRRDVDDREFVDLLSAANLIPGPTSTELAMHIGYRRARWTGLAVAGLAFATPAVVIVLGLAWVYVTWGALPAVGAVLAGLAPVVVAIVAHATVVLGRAAVGTAFQVVVAAAALAASIAGLPEIGILAAGGLAGLGLATARGFRPGDPERPAGSGRRGGGLAAMILPGVLAAPLSTLAASAPLGLFLTFLKIGSILFGSGYLLVALLRSELVLGAGLISERELLDAIAVGQFTPGPVFTTATFVGFLVLGLPGAVLATLGMALPAFGFVALSIPVIDRLRGSPLARAALDAVGAAVVGLLVAVIAALARTAIVTPPGAVIAAVAFGLLIAGRAAPVRLLGAGALAGVAADLLGAPLGG